jgi:APA family basic amino acid/polyamine antiporter
MSAPDPPEGGLLARTLGPIDATCVVVGAIIGVGIFFTPSQTAALTRDGGLMLLAWGIAGAIALCGALTFAELGGMYHASGAQYGILRDAYGPLPAFLFVFCNATAVQAGAIGIIAVVCARNLIVAGAGAGPNGSTSAAAVLALATLLVVLIAGANIIGVRWGSRIQNLTVYAKVLVLLAVTGLAAALGRSDVLGAAGTAVPIGTRGSLGHVSAVLAALVPAFFSFGGWQHALWISGKVREPGRNLPRAIVGGVVLVIAVYMLANWSYLKLLGVGRVAASEALAADAVGSVFPMLGGRVIAAAVAVSAFGVLNAQLLSGPWLVFSMARDGRFFKVFGGLSGRFGTPVWSILLLAGIALTMLLAVGADGVNTLLNGVVFVDSAFFVLTGAALIVLRRKRPSADRPMRVPAYPVVPLLFVIGEIGVLIGAYLDPSVAKAAVVGAAWIAAAAVLFLVRFRTTSGETRIE